MEVKSKEIKCNSIQLCKPLVNRTTAHDFFFVILENKNDWVLVTFSTTKITVHIRGIYYVDCRWSKIMQTRF